jgi:hypothetical protein
MPTWATTRYPTLSRPARYHIHYSLQVLLLHKIAIQVEEHGATYKRCLQSCFKGQIGHNLEVYVDDIIIKIW